MLTESFLVSTLASGKPNKNAPSKDVGIHLYDLQPTTALKSSYKKSSTQPNCLAASTSHVFAAQAEKAVIHVYSRQRGNQEAVVPFPEKIRSIVLCGDVDGGGVLALGTEGGGVILWEVRMPSKINGLVGMLKIRSSYALAVKYLLHNPTCSQQHVSQLTRRPTSSYQVHRTASFISGLYLHYFPSWTPQPMTRVKHCLCPR